MYVYIYVYVVLLFSCMFREAPERTAASCCKYPQPDKSRLLLFVGAHLFRRNFQKKRWGMALHFLPFGTAFLGNTALLIHDISASADSIVSVY